MLKTYSTGEINNLPDLLALSLLKDDLKQVENKMRSQVLQDYPDLAAALDILLSTGGKRIRPTLTLLVGKILNGEKEKVITLAAAIEMLHTATLVHDDLIDGALLRRGVPTLNSRWSPSATVLTGDYLFARAAGLAAQADSLPAMRLFADTLALIVNGEIAQLFNRFSADHMPELSDYYQRIEAKTAALFRTACLLAAYVSPADQGQLEAVSTFGLQIGLAFQIIDDILDFIGSSDVVGKPVGSDLQQGIITLPVIFYIEEEPPQKELLAQVLQYNRDPSLLQHFIEQVNNSSAIIKSFDKARYAVQEAIKALSSLPNNQARQALEQLAAYIIERKL